MAGPPGPPRSYKYPAVLPLRIHPPTHLKPAHSPRSPNAAFVPPPSASCWGDETIEKVAGFASHESVEPAAAWAAGEAEAHMTNQDVVVSEMGIAAGAALPGASPALLACRGAAAGAMSLRYLDLAAAAARSASCTWVDAMRASSPTRSRAAADVDEFTAWMVS